MEIVTLHDRGPRQFSYHKIISYRSIHWSTMATIAIGYLPTDGPVSSHCTLHSVFSRKYCKVITPKRTWKFPHATVFDANTLGISIL